MPNDESAARDLARVAPHTELCLAPKDEGRLRTVLHMAAINSSTN